MASEQQAEHVETAPYERPELIRHGDIDELTQGNVFTGNVGDCASTDC